MQFDFARRIRQVVVVSSHPLYSLGLIVMIGLAIVMIVVPLKSAGKPDDPAPPLAMM